MKRLTTAAIACFTLSLLLFTSCRKNRVTCSGISEKMYANSQFINIATGDNMKVTIVKGNVFSVKANGCNEDLADLVTEVLTNGTLKFSYANARSNRKAMNISITMPELRKITGTAAATFHVTGMANPLLPIQVDLSGASEAIINGISNDVIFNLSGASKLELNGTSDAFIGDLDGASLLKAYGLAAKQTDITASGASKAYVTAQIKLYAEAYGASIIYYKGTPVTIHTASSGSAKVIKEL